MLRVTVAETNLTEVVLRVEGWLSGGNVSLLEQEGSPWFGSLRRVVLDLDGVRFIDEPGVRLVRDWIAQGAVTRGGSAFVRLMLVTTQGDES